MSSGHTPRCPEFTCDSCEKARARARRAKAKARCLTGVTRKAVPRPEWQQDALCSQVDGDLWFPEKGGSTRDAKRICRSCPVMDECRSHALAHQERHGVWGGYSERERRKITQENP